MPLTLWSNAPSPDLFSTLRSKLPHLVSSRKLTTRAPVSIAHGARQHSQTHRSPLSYEPTSSPGLGPGHADRTFIFSPSFSQCSDADEDIFPHKSSIHDPFSFISSATNSLVRLSFAQLRRDIRWRQEGFEMTPNTTEDLTPFALRSLTLVPLSVAFSRDDIRRRNEAFEAVPDRKAGSGARVSPSNRIAGATEPPLGEGYAPSGPSIHLRNSTFSTFGPIYSRSMYARPSFALSADDGLSFLDDTVIAVYEEYGALSLYELGYANAGEELKSRATSPNTSLDDFLDFGLASSTGGCTASSI